MDERTVSTVEDTWRRFESAGVASLSWARVVCAAAGVFAVLGWPVTAPGKSLYPLGDTVENERLSKDPIPFKTPAQIEARPKLFGEIGDPFLDTGKLDKGFEVPLLGAIWQPRLWVYYIYRTALQTFDNGVAQRETEWSNRLDLYANLQLTGTEKLFLGLRPLDNNVPNRFTRYTFSGANEDFNNELNLDVETLFFEGDLGSLIPALDRKGITPLDFGFTIGRQPFNFQEGILINDTVDAVGFIRNNIVFPGTSNLRISGLWGWHRLDRNDTRDGSDPQMFGLFVAADTHKSTFNFDMVYVDDDLADGDALNVGLSAIQRFGLLGTAFRINSSNAFDNDLTNTAADGILVSAEFSWHPPSADDIIYVNPFYSWKNYTQAGREPILGGPLASLGILFASPNLSTYGAEINPFTEDVAGAAIGYQAFWDNNRRNLILEIAGRKDTDEGDDAIGFGFQLQQAFGSRFQVQLEAFYTVQERRDDAIGARVELQVVH